MKETNKKEIFFKIFSHILSHTPSQTNSEEKKKGDECQNDVFIYQSNFQVFEDKGINFKRQL